MNTIGVLGGRSLVGHYLLPLLVAKSYRTIAFSRSRSLGKFDNVEWALLPQGDGQSGDAFRQIQLWVSLVPVWILAHHLNLLDACGARKIIALSSTSIFTKKTSTDPYEQLLVNRLADGESKIKSWAKAKSVDIVILRPSLIYSMGLDRNITEIARFIRYFGFFPVLGNASGLRQPVHAEDVAFACISAMEAPVTAGKDYNISGAERLPYRTMVEKVFAQLGRSPVILSVPLFLIKLVLPVVKLIPRCSKWSIGMAERMNQDMVFDHADAARDFGFAPRRFLSASVDGSLKTSAPEGVRP